MDSITFAKKNGIPLKNIPSGIVKKYQIPSFIIKKAKSRTLDLNQQLNYLDSPTSFYVDADSSRIQYTSIFSETAVIDFINSQTNLMDKILSFNPKQIGIVNPNIELVFDYGNQLHFLACKYSPIPIFESTQDFMFDERLPLNDNKIVFFSKENRRLYSYGDLNINNILFSDILYRLYDNRVTDSFLDLNENINVLYDLNNVRNIPYKFSSSIDEIGSEITIPEIPSPLNFSLENTVFSENIIIDKTVPIWDSYSVTLQAGLDYSKSGSDITQKNSNTGFSILDDKLKKIYSWKSALVIFEKANQIKLSANQNISKYEFALLVGIKTVDFKISERIESLYYVSIGDNYYNNILFSKKDIFMFNSSLKKMLSRYKSDFVHFLDLSDYNYGNICQDGLLFGMSSKLQDYIIDLINKNDNQFVKTNGKIENLYELFEKV